MSTVSGDGDLDLGEVLGIVEAGRDQTEADRRSTHEVVAALAEAGLFRLQSPPVVGGAEMAPLDALQIFETLAAVDATAAWAVWNNTTGPPWVPVVRLAFLPADACKIVDTWNAGRLRGSGSHDVVVEDFWIESDHAPGTSDPIQLPGPLFHLPIVAVLGSGCVSVALALARVSIEAVVNLAATKKRTGAHPTFSCQYFLPAMRRVTTRK